VAKSGHAPIAVAAISGIDSSAQRDADVRFTSNNSGHPTSRRALNSIQMISSDRCVKIQPTTNATAKLVPTQSVLKVLLFAGTCFSSVISPGHRLTGLPLQLFEQNQMK
jgi:hypothetical protein